MPRNSLTNGKQAPDSFNTQLDECAYPLVMALAVGLTGSELLRGPHQAGGELRRHATGRRSARSAGRSRAASRRRRSRPRSPACWRRRRSPTATATTASARVWRGVADEFQRNLKRWTLTTNGPLERRPYFIRLSKTGDPNAAISYGVGNGGPTLDQRDGHRRRLPRVRAARRARRGRPGPRPLAAVVDATIRRSTDSGVGFYRYNGDGYGDRSSATAARGRRPRHRATATCGRCSPASAGSASSTAATSARRSARLEAMHGDGLGRRPDPRAGVGGGRPRPLAVRHRSDARPRSASRTASRPAPPRR